MKKNYLLLMFLIYSTIIVKDIQNMPKNFTFDRVEVKVTGLD
ncbi:hypothetical protein NXW09_28310 [Bacteroides ovatus]|nr:hypothetical protein [Bacteroides ovatus]